jgi:hypothetical protein
VVPLSSSDDNLSLVKHDAWVDLNPGGARICYTKEPALVLDKTDHATLCQGSRYERGTGKVLIANPDYRGKGHNE